MWRPDVRYSGLLIVKYTGTSDLIFRRVTTYDYGIGRRYLQFKLHHDQLGIQFTNRLYIGMYVRNVINYCLARLQFRALISI